VLLLQKSDHFGGTTCYSAGTCWVPGTKSVEQAGISDMTWPRPASTPWWATAAKERWLAYLHNGPKMIDYKEQQTYGDCGTLPTPTKPAHR
jgi:3-oxosteroid 1-dehydrogenase